MLAWKSTILELVITTLFDIIFLFPFLNRGFITEYFRFDGQIPVYKD